MIAATPPPLRRRPSLRDFLAAGGLFHCTPLRTLWVILRDGHLRPACQTGAPAQGAGVASRTRRLGGVSLFDVLPQPAGAAGRNGDDNTTASSLPAPVFLNPGRGWLTAWLTSRRRRSIMVAIDLDRARLLAQGGALLDGEQTRRLVSGLMLVGEVCHVGAIPLAKCARGFLFVVRRGGDGADGAPPCRQRRRRGHLPRGARPKVRCYYVAGNHLTNAEITRAVRLLREEEEEKAAA